jgi:hypothetical protein
MTYPPRNTEIHQERFSMSFQYGDAPAKAAGLITCVTNANMADGDYITIGDGIGVPVLYEYDKSANGVTGGRTSWAAGAGSAATVAATLKTAIEATQKSITVVDNADGTLTLTSKIPGAFANVTITENVTNAGFLVTGMSGGTDASSYNLGPVKATESFELTKATRAMYVDRVEHINPTGLAADAANYWTLALKDGANVIASWSTLTGAEGAIVADTPADMTLNTDGSKLAVAVGDTVALALTKTASAANLPPGRIVVHGRFV